MDFWNILQLGIASGLVAGIVNQLAAALREKWTRQHDSEERQKARDHEALLRAEADHVAARDRYLEKARLAHDWITADLTRAYGDDANYVGTRGIGTGNVRDAVLALDEIRAMHPTREVRNRAADLARSLDNFFGEMYFGDPSENEPSTEEYRKWAEQAEGLMEAMHAPPLGRSAINKQS